jgi:hypothetical protein
MTVLAGLCLQPQKAPQTSPWSLYPTTQKVLSMSQCLIILEQGRLLADGLTEKMLPS